MSRTNFVNLQIFHQFHEYFLLKSIRLGTAFSFLCLRRKQIGVLLSRSVNLSVFAPQLV